MRVAIMVACYNRKETTRRCLNILKEQIQRHLDKEIDIYVYDDNSTDGTYEMLKENFPEVISIRGKGNAYWAKSMHRLMQLAVNEDYDFYLMINDDVIFYSDAIETMFRSYYLIGSSGGVVGATKFETSDRVSYGGSMKHGELLMPNGTIQKCLWANWNCFLIDREVAKKVGMMDGKYQHAWGDFDYSHRMVKKGFSIYVADQYIGECEQNTIQAGYGDATLKKTERLRNLFSIKGVPFRSYFRYHIKSQGFWGGVKAIYGYCSMIGYILLNKEIGNNGRR